MLALFALFSLSYEGWFPSFCVMMQILDKEAAARIISFVFTFNLVLRGISVFLKIKSVTYLKATCYLNAGLFGVVGFLLYGLGFRVFLVYSTAFLYPFITFMFLPTMFTVHSIK